MPVNEENFRKLQGALIRKEMERLDITQMELAEALETDQPRISNILAGRRPCSPATLFFIASYMCVPVSRLFPTEQTAFRYCAEGGMRTYPFTPYK